jgi:pentose-5-phosphate-3-epimerase
MNVFFGFVYLRINGVRVFDFVKLTEQTHHSYTLHTPRRKKSKTLTPLIIDGGVDPSIIKDLKGLNIKQFVSGSYLANHECIETALNSFEDSLQ